MKRPCIARADAAGLESLPVPDHFTAASQRACDVDMFEGVEDEDIRKSLIVGDVPMPEFAPEEADRRDGDCGQLQHGLAAVFEPLPTFRFLKELGKAGRWEARHDLPHHETVGEDPHVVFEHVGMKTFTVSVFLARRGRDGLHLRIQYRLRAHLRTTATGACG
ncbi:hypothetical protein AQJ27_50655 [Streptomyces olivochromogenes]|uniref:Crotonyl-CoA reductase n=2 Tax=Streptomyces olivochromogenes TaxID=1963 RepID=A0A286PGT7_STROL|nr:hypothetical protein AQJ27_50655 [Streptomyces olivochromogenes]GAX58766.1 crotonyl-CoA reductase [Streptomyces olivochromogenes]